MKKMILFAGGMGIGEGTLSEILDIYNTINHNDELIKYMQKNDLSHVIPINYSLSIGYWSGNYCIEEARKILGHDGLAVAIIKEAS